MRIPAVWRQLAAFVLILMLSVPAGAAEFDPEIICKSWPVISGQEKVDPKSFVSELFVQTNLTPERLGIHTDEVNQRYQALLDPDYCSNHSCKKDAAKALGDAKILLAEFWRSHKRKPANGGFYIQPELPKESSQRYALYKSFFNGGSDVQVVCVSPPDQTPHQAKEVAEQKARAVAFNASPISKLRLRKDPLGLKVEQRDSNGQISDAFKGLDAADFSMSRDYRGHANTFNIDMTLGYSFGHMALRKDTFEYAELIPFFRFTRQSVQSDDPNAADVRNVGGGLVSSFHIMDSKGQFHTIDYYPEYTHSNGTGASVLSQNVVFTPGWTGRGFGGRDPIPNMPLSFMASVQFKGVYGTVMQDGGDALLRGLKDYERLGPRVQFWLYGDEAFNGWSLSASYEFLKAMRGPLYAVRRFEAKLSYEMPKTDYWSVDLKYVNGRNLETLEEQQQITLGLGLKY